MKKTYIEPATKIAIPVLASFMAASGGADSTVNDGQSGGIKNEGIDEDKDGSDESDAKSNAWSSWDD